MRIAVVKPEGLNLRICASSSSDILDQLPQGERLFVSDLGTANGWAFVTVERTRQLGYVLRKHIEIILPQLPPAPKPAPKPKSHPVVECWLWAAVVVIAIAVAWLFALNN